MGSRKRAKPNPEADPTVGEQSAVPEGEQPVIPEGATSPETSNASDEPNTLVSRTLASGSIKNWYGGGWPRTPKVAPIAELAKESASINPDVDPSTRTKRNPSLQLARSLAGSSSRSLPLSATTTKINVSSSGSSQKSGISHSDEATLESLKDKHVEEPSDTIGVKESTAVPEKSDNIDSFPKKKPSDTGTDAAGHSTATEDQPLEAQPGWFGWLLNRDYSQGSNSPNTEEASPSEPIRDDGSHDTVMSGTSETIKKVPSKRRNSESDVQAVRNSGEQTPPRSWFPLWNTSVAQVQETKTITDLDASLEPTVGDQPKDETTAQKPKTASTGITASSGWIFWSRNQAEDGKLDDSSKPIVGEMAVAGSTSQSKPQEATVDHSSTPPKMKTKSGKRQRPRSSGGSVDTKTKVFKDKNSPSAPAISSPLAKAKPVTPVPSITPQNLILPGLKQTFQSEDSPNLLQRLTKLLYMQKTSQVKHVHILSNPPKIRRALVIGVHGYFPAPLIRTVLGQPTGTSIKFAESAAAAIQQWTQDRGYSCEIEKAALEGEGKIEERVELLWKLMLNWIEHIRKADFILVACHSQGVPVAIMLVAKLISFGCLNGARIGICAMAGVNLGPFADYKSRWIGGSAGELFDFAKPDSKVSRDYDAALSSALEFGVKVVYVGSIDDQLVSLESSTFGVVHHPYVYRAVFVDGRVHAPDFLTHLVGFILKLRNLGISDHGLIRELSSPLAGSLYGGEGHSRIYEDPAIYRLAIEFALETTALEQVPVQIDRSLATTSQNPYILPFAIRGVLEEEHVRNALQGETQELLKQFDDWKPTSKVLKDVKFRLEGVRSKL